MSLRRGTCSSADPERTGTHIWPVPRRVLNHALSHCQHRIPVDGCVLTISIRMDLLLLAIHLQPHHPTVQPARAGILHPRQADQGQWRGARQDQPAEPGGCQQRARASAARSRCRCGRRVGGRFARGVGRARQAVRVSLPAASRFSLHACVAFCTPNINFHHLRLSAGDAAQGSAELNQQGPRHDCHRRGASALFKV